MNDSIQKHCRELDRCNQRGRRMLSIFDLLDAQTLDLDLAAYLMARISTGASFMVGASPGGAGKTTVMCALLNLMPLDIPIIAATPQAVRKASQQEAPEKSCYLCHEISPGHYYAYLWSEELRRYCSLFEKNHMLVTNLHADDLDEAREQICSDNQVPLDYMHQFELCIFLGYSHYFSPSRRIEKVYSGDGKNEHDLIFEAQRKSPWKPKSKAYKANAKYVVACRLFLQKTRKKNIRTIEQTRERVEEFFRIISGSDW
jgi:hypothetical protein